MLLRLGDLFNDPRDFVIQLLLWIVALLVGLTVHEFSHALVADRLGDPTPRRHGRLSLNPGAHLDPFGSLMILLVGFGWGKPVPVNTLNLQNGRRGMALVALAGPISNLLLAFAFAIPIRIGATLPSLHYLFTGTIGTADLPYLMLWTLVKLNAVLAVFNLLPIPPLDGSNVLLGILPDDAARSYARLMPYGPLLLLAVIMIAFLTPFDLLGHIMNPVIDFVRRLALGY